MRACDRVWGCITGAELLIPPYSWDPILKRGALVEKTGLSKKSGTSALNGTK